MSEETTAEARPDAEAGQGAEKDARAEKDAGAEKAAPPKPYTPPRVRQWVTLRSGSMDLRAGTGILSDLAQTLKSAVGRPHGCALVYEAGATADAALETLRRSISDKGFDLRIAELPASTCDLAAVAATDELLAELKITADDVVVAVGGYEALSVASFACSTWCGGVSLAEVPLDPAAAVAAATTPRALDLPGLPRMVEREGTARFSTIDTELFDLDVASEPMRLAFALMVQTAVCESDKAFGRLWDAADELASGSESALVAQLQDSVKSRGKVVASTSAAVRQSMELGRSFAHALMRVAGPDVAASTALGDGLRFASRLGVALESLAVDDMFAVDELLERLGVGETDVAVDERALLEALVDERFRRTNRLMLALPRSLGRVRLAAVAQETLAEHVGAWCASRPAADAAGRA